MIMNKVHLADKLNNIQIDFNLVYFDVPSLFTQVPVDVLPEYLVDTVDNLDLHVSNSVFLELIKLCRKTMISI